MYILSEKIVFIQLISGMTLWILQQVVKVPLSYLESQIQIRSHSQLAGSSNPSRRIIPLSS